MGKPKRIRDLKCCSRSRIAASRQNVDDHRGRADAVIKRFLAGSFDGGKTISRNASEYGDHLPITVVSALQSLADLFHRGWQDPFAEGSTITQGTGFASQDRNIVPGVVDSVATTKAAPVFSDRHSILFDDNPIGIGVNLDRAADGCRQDRIFVVVETDGAGLRHRGWDAVEPVKWADVAHKAATLGLEHLPDRLRRLFGMAMGLGIGNAFIEEPSIQFLRLLTLTRGVKKRSRTRPTWFST
ncbi:conserved hypothetical protein [Agrobacterium fabacearum S56]|nr:conserved hypothetical protein [Agrobacterium fabacearum S56]